MYRDDVQNRMIWIMSKTGCIGICPKQDVLGYVQNRMYRDMSKIGCTGICQKQDVRDMSTTGCIGIYFKLITARQISFHEWLSSINGYARSCVKLSCSHWPWQWCFNRFFMEAYQVLPAPSLWQPIVEPYCELRRKEGNVLFNDTLNTFYLRLYAVIHMVKDHSDSERGNKLPPHGLLFPISSKGSFICIIPQTG